MPQGKGPGRGIVKSGNAGNSSKPSPPTSKTASTSTKSEPQLDKEKPLFPPGSKYPLSLLNERYRGFILQQSSNPLKYLRCQKNDWQKPEVIAVSIPPGSDLSSEDIKIESS